MRPGEARRRPPAHRGTASRLLRLLYWPEFGAEPWPWPAGGLGGWVDGVAPPTCWPTCPACGAALAEAPDRPLIALTPRGEPLTQSIVRGLAAGPGAVLLCGRYEGVDQRVVEARGMREISVGDYVLSGGELPAMVLLDAIARRLPGALAEGSGEHESFSAELEGGLEYPHYTRPAEFRGWTVPDVLLSGDHGRVADWRRDQSRERSTT